MNESYGKGILSCDSVVFAVNEQVVDVNSATQHLLKLVSNMENRGQINACRYLCNEFHVVEIGPANWRIIDEYPKLNGSKRCHEPQNLFAICLQRFLNLGK
ncbi:MAG: hypothetical protein ACKOE7_04510 [Actinomycetota bacterium]